MRSPFGRSLTSPTLFGVLCACCVLWSAPAVARAGGISIDKRVLILIAMGCVVGMIAGCANGGPRETGFRLLHKPKKERLSVLVPPGPAPRLVPSDSPHATRARSNRAEVSRQTTADATRGGAVDYLAAFAESEKAKEVGRVDYLLLSTDSVDESVEPAEELDASLRRAG